MALSYNSCLLRYGRFFLHCLQQGTTEGTSISSKQMRSENLVDKTFVTQGAPIRQYSKKNTKKTSLIKNVFDFDEKRGCMLCRYQGQAGGCPPSLLQNVPNGFPPTFSLALRLIS